jgi:hypothetical protein
MQLILTSSCSGVQKYVGIFIFTLAALFVRISHAESVDIKSVVAIPYSKGFFSTEPDSKDLKSALIAGKRAVWDTYTSHFNDAKMNVYLKLKDKALVNLDQFVTNARVIDQVVDEKTQTINLAIRASINVTAFDGFLTQNSVAGTQATGQGNPFVFLFIARQASSSKAYDDKRVSVAISDKSVAQQDKSESLDESETSVSKTSISDKRTSGGSTERKKANTAYEITSSQDIDAAMGDVFTSSGFEVISYDDVVANCGGIDRSKITKEFAVSDDMSTDTRKSAINATRQCEVGLFATGTVDIGLRDTDPVSGNKRVFVSVRGQVWNIESKLPKKVASVGPIQFSGMGPDEDVAKRNALIKAARESAKVIADQLNSKGIH